MTASDHLGVQFYAGDVPPGQVQPRQRGIVAGKVDKLAGHMADHGYSGIPPIETRGSHGELHAVDGHHRREAALRTGLATVPVFGMVHTGGLPAGTHAISRQEHDGYWNAQ